jgi:hypothetical protein
VFRFAAGLAKITIVLSLFGSCLLARAEQRKAPPAQATPLDLIWNTSPVPFNVYRSCESATSNDDFCVSAGEWIGLCQSADKKSFDAKKGSITIDKEGNVTFSACESYGPGLFSPSAAHAAGIVAGAHIISTDGCDAIEGPIAKIKNRLIKIKVSEKNGILAFDWSEKAAPPKITDREMCDAGPTFPKATGHAQLNPGFDAGIKPTEWLVAKFEDLNGDGFPEILMSSTIKNFEPSEMAFWLSLKPQAAVLARTVTIPRLGLHSPQARTVLRLRALKEACEHWGGEEAYDDARAKEISAGSSRDCGEFEKQLKAARKAYPKNAELKKMQAE